MGKLFLGKWWHWLLVTVIVGLLWQAGAKKLHVIEFNTFIMLLLAGAVISVVLLIKTTRPGEQITRDPLVDAPDDEAGDITARE